MSESKWTIERTFDRGNMTVTLMRSADKQRGTIITQDVDGQVRQGKWFARNTEFGRDYVANVVWSWRTAVKTFEAQRAESDALMAY